MKKILLSFGLIASVSLGLFAQPKEGGHRGGDRAKSLQELNLSSEQQDKIKTLSEDYKTKNTALRSQQRDLRKNHQANIEAILTPEQQVKWQELTNKRTNRDHRGGKSLGRRGKGGKHMKLDASAIAKLDDLRSNFEKEKKAVEMSRIAPEVQKERIRSLRDKYRTDKREIIKASHPKREGNPAV